VSELNFRVIGLPGAQGSKRHVGNGRMVESSKAVAPWRDSVATAAVVAAQEQGWTAPPQVIAHIVFSFRRPKHHYRTGRNAHLLRNNAHTWHSVAPDVDKLQRSTFDALTTAGVIADDARIVSVYASKRYAEADEPTGALIILTPAGA
jgi:Holliday junction resolvase RusA-like endonuclease